MVEHMIFGLIYLPLKISVISLERAELPPYLGSTLRGGIGQWKKSENQQDVVIPYIIIPPEFHGKKYIVDRGKN